MVEEAEERETEGEEGREDNVRTATGVNNDGKDDEETHTKDEYESKRRKGKGWKNYKKS